MADRPRDLEGLLRRQIERYGPQLRALESEDDDDDVPPAPGPLSDEQLAQFRAEIDRVRPGMAGWFLETYKGPMPEWWLDALEELPPGFPATKGDFLAQHEVMRRLLGDLRPRPTATGSDGEERPGSNQGD